MFNIEMLPAGHGDSLLLEYGDSTARHHVLIDAGPYYAYKRFARRIDQLASSGETLELFVVTHIDTDHIDGAIKLLRALPSGIHFDDFWFNGYRHLLPGPTENTEPPPPQGKMLNVLLQDPRPESGQVALRGAVQGEMLTVEIEDSQPWNEAFHRDAVALRTGRPLPTVTLPGGLALTILSPEVQDLIKLRRNWMAELRDAHLDTRSHDEILAKLRESPRYRARRAGVRIDVNRLAAEPFEEDNSRSNASSIAFLAEYGGKTCLFAADAHPTRLVASVKTLLRERREARLKVDAVKVAHHGSRGNTSPQLLSLLDCKHFLFSTNSKVIDPPHPHPEAIARIIRDCGPGVNLWFNFRSAQTQMWEDADLTERHHYAPHYPEQGHEGLVVPLAEL
jgi:beta-lactamase superfamily II metal-dependent hydrolase